MSPSSTQSSEMEIWQSGYGDDPDEDDPETPDKRKLLEMQGVEQLLVNFRYTCP